MNGCVRNVMETGSVTDKKRSDRQRSAVFSDKCRRWLEKCSACNTGVHVEL